VDGDAELNPEEVNGDGFGRQWWRRGRRVVNSRMSTHVFLGDLSLGNTPYPVVVLNALSSILYPPSLPRCLCCWWEWKKVRFVEENGQGWHTKKAKALDVAAQTET
jgi:hypothetical protein